MRVKDSIQEKLLNSFLNTLRNTIKREKVNTARQVDRESLESLSKSAQVGLEAEAILNALKADESNLKPRKYKAFRQIKLEKDW